MRVISNLCFWGAAQNPLFNHCFLSTLRTIQHPTIILTAAFYPAEPTCFQSCTVPLIALRHYLTLQKLACQILALTIWSSSRRRGAATKRQRLAVHGRTSGNTLLSQGAFCCRQWAGQGGCHCCGAVQPSSLRQASTLKVSSAVYNACVCE